jgi:hypothetical protein
LFQTLYQPPASLFSYLPFTLEWNVVGVVFLALVLLSGHHPLLGLIPFLISWGMSISGALKAPIDQRFQSGKARMLVAVLIYLGPLVRAWERYLWRVRGLTTFEPVESQECGQQAQIGWSQRSLYLSFWSPAGLEKENIIQSTMDFLISRKYFMTIDQGWSDWDIKISQGLWSRAWMKVCTENHGGDNKLFRVQCALKTSKSAKLLLLSCGAIALLLILLQVPVGAIATAIAGVGATAVILFQNWRLGQTMSHVLEIQAKKLQLIPAATINTMSD